jgi:hypothetical protein
MHPAEAGELAAMRALFAAAPPDLGALAEEVGGALCISLRAAPTSAMFNRALGLGLERPATEDDLAAIDAFFRAREVEYCIALSPEARPSELMTSITLRGLVRGYAWAKFSRGVVVPPEVKTELRVEEVSDGADFAAVFTRAYGTPPFLQPWIARVPGRPGWHCFLAYADEEPAATGAIYVEDGVGWLGAAGTLPEHRRKGAQNAILAARIRAAAEARCRVVVTETGALQEGRPSHSYHNILRAGFEFLYERANLLSSPEADTSGTR